MPVSPSRIYNFAPSPFLFSPSPSICIPIAPSSPFTTTTYYDNGSEYVPLPYLALTSHSLSSSEDFVDVSWISHREITTNQPGEIILYILSRRCPSTTCHSHFKSCPPCCLWLRQRAISSLMFWHRCLVIIPKLARSLHTYHEHLTAQIICVSFFISKIRENFCDMWKIFQMTDIFRFYHRMNHPWLRPHWRIGYDKLLWHMDELRYRVQRNQDLVGFRLASVYTDTNTMSRDEINLKRCDPLQLRRQHLFLKSSLPQICAASRPWTSLRQIG